MEKSEIESGKGMAVLSYIGILALIPYFAEKKNKYVRFHAVQGINIMLILVGWTIIASIISGVITSALTAGCVSWWFTGSTGTCNPGLASLISFILWLPSMVIGILCIIGIVNAASGKAKELPILGKIKIIKK